MANQFFIRQGKKISGPVGVDELKQLVASGDLGPNDEVSREADKWVRARMVRGLGLDGAIDVDHPFDVFISYSTQNRFEANAVCAKLEESGIRCWIAPRDILPGMEWGEGIILGIDQSWVMVLIFSGHSNESPQVRREIERASSKQLPVLPFRLEEVPLNSALEYCLGNSHWFDALDLPLEQRIESLTDDVRRLLNNRRMTSGRAAQANRSFPRPPEEEVESRRFSWQALVARPWLYATIAAAVLIAATTIWWCLSSAGTGQLMADQSTNAAIEEVQIAGGAWQIEGDELVERPSNKNGLAVLMFGRRDWSRYNLTFKAKVVSGKRCFGVRFNAASLITYRKFQMGAFDNQYHLLSTFIDNVSIKNHRRSHKGHIESNRWYDVRLEVRGSECQCMLDGVAWFSCDDQHLKQGRIGLFAEQTGVRFRDIKVRSADDKTVLWQGIPELPSRD